MSFIHFLKWNTEHNTLEQMEEITTSTRTTVNSAEDIEDIVSNCLEKKFNEIPDFIRHLYKRRGTWYLIHDTMTISHLSSVPLYLHTQIVNRKHTSGPRLYPYKINYNDNAKL